MSQTPRRLALPLVLSCLLSACSAPGPAAPGRVTIRGHLAVQDAAGRHVLGGGPVVPWGAVDIDHVVLALADAAAPASPVGTVTIAKADLATNGITFSNLGAYTDYRIVAQAYRLPRDTGGEQEGSEIDAGGDGCTTAFSTSNVEVQDLGAVRIQLADKPFAGAGTGTGLAITAGGYAPHQGSVGGSLLTPVGAGAALQGRVSAPLGALAGVTGMAGGPDGVLYLYGALPGAPGSLGFRKLGPTGVASTLAVTGSSPSSPSAMAVDADGVLYAAQGASVYKIATDGTGVVLASSLASSVLSLATDGQKALYAALADGTIQKLDAAGAPTLFKDGFTGVLGMAFDPDGNLFALDTAASANTIYRIAPDATRTVFSGEAAAGETGLVRDSHGSFYTADPTGNVIRRFNASGDASVFAGSGAVGSAGGTGIAASFHGPLGLAYTASPEALYVFDSADYRKIL